MNPARHKALKISPLLVVMAIVAALLAADMSLAQSSVSTKVAFRIKLDQQVATEPISGRILLFFSKGMKDPMSGPNWFSPEPFFGKDVVDMKPGDEIVLDNQIRGFPGTLDDIKSGRWKVQAVLDHDFNFADHKYGAGNLYSDAARLNYKNGEDNGEISLLLNNVIEAKKIEDTVRFKLVENKSELLSAFHKRDVVERAGVILPASYESSPDKRYPVYYDISGFSGTLDRIKARYGANPVAAGEGEAEFIHVYLTGQCKWGHHVYADSATNGPRGKAFISEMIPLIDSKFRTIAEPTARFVGGHSSGGWSSLWLQVTYPESFGGVWSTAPDPVDFRDWQGSAIYKGESVFFEADGKTKKPLARMNGRTLLWYADFTKMDDAMGRGGQIRSFEAVFSPLGEDGLPRYAFDRQTGLPNPEVIEYWKRYDIGLILEKKWAEMEEQLSGKIHVYMGDEDTFYLENATRLLGERLKAIGSDAVVEMFPGKDHMNLLDKNLRRRIMLEMTAAFRKHHPE